VDDPESGVQSDGLAGEDRFRFDQRVEVASALTRAAPSATPTMIRTGTLSRVSTTAALAALSFSSAWT
jgi:hypothetical protein